MADEVFLKEGVPFKIVDLGDGTFALKTSAGITGTVDVSDRAARDLGKVDVALLDQYTPVDVDSGAGTSNALPMALRVPGAGGATIPGDATNGLDVDVTRVADGADVVQGAVADAAITTDAVGTISGKLRGLVSLFVSLLARLPAALGAGGGLKVDGSGTALPVSGATQDAGPSWTQGRLLTTSADLTGAADVTAAPTASQKIVIDDVLVGADTAMYVAFLEETSGTEVFRVYLAANSTAQFTPRGKLKLATADKKLRGDASVAGNVAITVLYHSEA